MELLALIAVAVLISLLIVPWMALSKANDAHHLIRQLKTEIAQLQQRLGEVTAALKSQPKADGPRAAAYSTPPATQYEPITPVVPEQVSVPVVKQPPAPWPEAPAKPPIAVKSPESAPPQPTPAPRPFVAAAKKPEPKKAEPSAFELQMRKWIGAAKEWLFGGNLVAKVGLLILFIGVAFLVRLASNYVTVPIEVRLAGVAAGAIALLAWGWRIRDSRRGIALPVQGAALAILMLTTFGAFKLFGVLPGGAAFALLFVLIVFTCLLAVMQDALWLAVFGIAGGFAAPILTSSGSGNYVALFTYYSLLNAGILAIALKRSWRLLNVLGFAFTFIVGAAWGEQRYVVDNYASAQAFLVLFWLFYIAIAVVYAWRRAPELKSYVDGTLVFGVPMAGMALQYGLVKDIPFGMAISSLVIAFTYAFTASVLWRWRQGTLRLLVESFLALAIVFGTLAIPLAFDGRWTSAAWAVEGAAIVWIGLKQKQALAWRFGVFVQLGSWIAFIAALTGLDPMAALKGNVGLSFLMLGVTGVLLALMFRRHLLVNSTAEAGGVAYEQRARKSFTWLANGFICVAVLWLLLGMWVEAWLRLDGAHRASMLVATALVLVYALQFLGRQSSWHLPNVLGGAVAAAAGVVFAALIVGHMDWSNAYFDANTRLVDVLTRGSLLGGLMLCGGAWISTLAFNRRLTDKSNAREQNIVQAWFLAAVFWWCVFALNGMAHVVHFLSTPLNADDAQNPDAWYQISFRAAYSVGLAISIAIWTLLARRNRLPNLRWTQIILWPSVTALALFLFWYQTRHYLGWSNLDATITGIDLGNALIALIAGPFLGACILTAIAWRALWTLKSQDLPVRDQRIGFATWIAGCGIVWYVWLIESIAYFFTQSTAPAEATTIASWWQLDFGHWALVLSALSAMFFLWRARVSQFATLRWLAVPAGVVQALVSAALLWTLYIDARLPPVATFIALTGCWFGIAWCLRYWTAQQWSLPDWTLRTLHFGRVIAPWLAIAPIVSLGLSRWLTSDTSGDIEPGDDGWIVVGMWPDYLAAWISIASLFVLLRQANKSAWPLTPLHAWYERALIPLATLWAVLAVVYWNLRQDGGMAPLPYLPILNPLDLTTGFAALLATAVWRANRAHMQPQWQSLGIKIAMGLAFAWLNLMLLRSAAQYLPLPYEFNALYHSQFVQAMLSIVWTLTAFLLMRFAARRLSKPLWMVGAGLLVAVVIKLFLVDLSNAGSIARIVSFIGVGGLMLAIGYIAPLPRKPSEETP
jgi:uncharacterized membrane protein